MVDQTAEQSAAGSSMERRHRRISSSKDIPDRVAALFKRVG